jgi:large subunit ribosomal protein L19
MLYIKGFLLRQSKSFKGNKLRNKYIQAYEQKQIDENNARVTLPKFRAGDTLRLSIEIKEGEKTRIQKFEGVCIALRGEGTGKTFMVRKIGANGIGIERIFPLYSDSIKELEVLKRGIVRRAKLFYLRDRTGKKAKIRERKTYDKK